MIKLYGVFRYEGQFIDTLEVFNVDKYEFNIKLEQIKKLAAKKEYKQAAQIAKEMNWNKVKDWSTLATVINVQEAAGDYEEARDMAILAYNRNLGGRKLIYKLTEFFIKVNDFENAEELYKEYAKISAHDVNRYILYYDLRRAQGAPDTELVKILEDYKESEIDEKYMYELANLYYKTGRREDCIKTCDNLVLWFQDGIYVENAVRLKEKLGVNLSNTQRRILGEINARKSDEEANKERMFMEQKELARLKKDEVGDVLEADELKKTEPDSVKEQPASEVKENIASEHDNDSSEDSDELSIDLVQNNQNSALKESIVKAIERQNEANKEAAAAIAENKEKQKAAEDNPAGSLPDSLSESLSESLSDSSDNSFSENVSKASLSLKELIENAKKKIENSCEKISREDEEEARRVAQKRIDEQADAMNIEVSVPNYSIYDTHNIQEELAKNVKNLFEDEQEETFRPPFERKDSRNNENVDKTLAKTASADTDSEQPYNDDQTEDEQIEGQLSITDWIESVREEKYGKQDTREFSKAELERMLDEKDEKSKAYERIIARKKEEALNKGTEFDEAEAKRLAEAEVALDSARRDLAMRTGKAAFILEQNTVKELKNAEEEAAKEVINTSDMAAQTPQNNSKVVNFDSLVEKDNKDDLNEELSLDTAKLSPVTDEMLKEYEQKQDKVDEASYAADSIAVQVNETAASYSETASVYSDSDSKEGKQMDDMDEEQSEKKLSGELAKIFRKYREMPGLEAQLVELFESLDKEMNMKTSACGNILISGNSSSDKTDLARTIVRAINYVYPDKPKKIAKTSGESINQRGIVKAMGKLKGTALIVEGAGTIQPKRINEIVSCMHEETDRMIVIFEDSDAEMNVLLNFNPELTKTFNHKITLKQYNVNELVEMAKRFARKRQYEVGDDALLELYLKIDKLHNINDNIKLDDIKEVVNKAIANSERRASRKFFGGLKKKRSDTGDVIFLTEADFKD